MPDPENPRDNAVDSLSLCCNGKKCPVFTRENGGVVLTDEERLGDARVEFTAEDAKKLRLWLESRGF